MRIWMALCCFGVTLAGCGGTDEVTVEILDSGSEPAVVAMGEPDMTPEEVADAFFSAGVGQDEELMMSYMTAKARLDMAGGGGGFNLSDETLSDHTVGTATVDGDLAEVPITFTQDGNAQDGALKMRIDDGPWRIYAMSVSIPNGPQITMNFEQISSMVEGFAETVGESLQEGMESVAQSMFGESPEDIQAHAEKYAALAARDMDTYRASWVNETDFSGGPARDALETLAARMDLTVDVVGLEEALSAPLDESLAGLSNLEAFERACRANGLYPIYPDIQDVNEGLAGAMVEALASGLAGVLDSEDSAISIEGVDGLQEALDKQLAGNSPENVSQILLKSGERPYPVAFAGPFLIEVTEVEENAPNPTGEVWVAARTFGLDAGVLGVQDLLSETMKIDDVVDAAGNALADTNIRYMGSPEAAGSAVFDSVGVDLTNLIRSVTHIESIDGSYDVLVPVNVEEVEFSDLEAGAVQTVGDVTITLKSSGENNLFEIRGPESQTENFNIVFLPLNAQGDPMAIQFDMAQIWSPGQGQAQLNTREAPASIRMKVLSGAVLESYPFSLEKTPLARYAEMPEKIEALAFAGHEAPLTVTFKEITERDPNFNKTLVGITNHCNKDALRISANFTYVNAAGEDLEEFPHSLNGVYTSDGQLPIAKSGAQGDEETTAFFMPEETQDIRIRVDEVEFTDGSLWKREP